MKKSQIFKSFSVAVAFTGGTAPVEAIPIAFPYTGLVDSWQVPSNGIYRITAIGGQGGEAANGNEGGFGAEVTGSIFLTEGETLTLYVGGMGDGSEDLGGAAGGGGGSFVIRNGNVPIMVAGGGGGGGYYHAGVDASLTPDGINGGSSAYHCGTNDSGKGGTNGSGGNPGFCYDVISGTYFGSGGGGGGFKENGGTYIGSFSGYGAGGYGFPSLAGGFSGVASGNGAFGGGGGGGYYGGGGGGGYSGGGGGNADFGGGGGGSFFSDEVFNPFAAIASTTGNGEINIEVKSPFDPPNLNAPEIDTLAGTGALTLLGFSLALAGERRRRTV